VTDTTGTAESRFLGLFDNDPLQAEAACMAFRQQLRRYFEWRGSEAPDDLADETLLRCVAKVAEGMSLDPQTAIRYFWGIARFVLFEQLKKRRNRPTVSFGDFEHFDPAAPPTNFDLPIYTEELLTALSPAERELLIDYYTTSKYVGTGERIRVRVYRIKQKLVEARDQAEALKQIPKFRQ